MHVLPYVIKNKVSGWKPAFGQINQSSSYLLNKGISKGDLFLFFGNFRHVRKVNGKYEYARGKKHTADAYYGRPMQAIWGYLHIGDIITDPEQQKQFFWHPHSCEKRVYEEKNNLIFTAADHLTFAPDMPGCGVLSYDTRRVLSMPGKTKATWKQNAAYDVKNIESNRRNSAKDADGIYYAGIWQELVLKETAFVIYNSQTGFTKKYAEWISGSAGCECMELGTAKKNSL